ncbi:MAG TPA: hypothetical protein VF422_07695 [Dokdonella sp.]
MDARHILAAISLVVVAAWPLAARSSSHYAVSMELSHQGKVFAAPSAVLREAEPARIEVAGADGYTLSLTLTDVRADAVELAVVLDSAHGNMAPTMVVAPGARAHVDVGALGFSVEVDRGRE